MSHISFCHGNDSRSKIWLATFDGPTLKTQYGPKDLADSFYRSRVIAHFVQNFVAISTGVGWEKLVRRYLLQKPSFGPFCLKFRCHGNGNRLRKKCGLQRSTAQHRKPPIDAKNNADISHRSRVIDHLVTNFVTMATGVGWGKMWIAAFDGPTPKTPYRRKNFVDISVTEAEL